jgi:Ca2+-binding EF-hand superfamily protein
MAKLIPLNSNEINNIPERYFYIPNVEGFDYIKSMETLLGFNPDKSKEEVLKEMFSSIDNALPLKNGKMEINNDLKDFLAAIDVKNKGKTKNQKFPKPDFAPVFKKKKDLNKKTPNVSI